MTDRLQDSGQTTLDVADRKMLAEIKASVLGVSRAELRIGRFRVLGQLGEGSMGVVFAALDDQLERRVAVKLLHQGVGASEDERKARLLREARILAQLEHPNIVQVYEAGEHEGQLFMAMELVEGRALDELQRTQAPEWKLLLPLYIAAGRGLAAAHSRDVVHRDFKPHNVLVDTKGRVRVVDFGLARESVGADQQLTAEILVADEGAIERPRIDHLTASGAVAGTPAYMAPELFDGQPASPASDQFSFCVALYEAVYGRRPFEGRRVQELVEAAKHGRILPPPEGRAAPRWLFDVLVRGLAASPEARFPSMEALLEELERDRARWWKRAGVVLGAVTVIGGTWWGSRYSGDDAAIRRHQRECGEQAAELAARWEDSKPRLARPPTEREDMDGLTAMLDADAKPFFTSWELACAVDVDEKKSSCRDEVRRAFEGAVERGMSTPLHVDAFHELTYDLELCVEERVACSGPEVESPAVLALGDARAAELAGNLDDARERVEAALALAAEAGDELTGLRATLRKGALLENGGRVEEAREVLRNLVEDALICDADVLAFDAALERAEVEVLHLGESALAQRALDVASRLSVKPGMSRLLLRHANLLEKRGDAALYLQHDCATALPLLENSLSLRKQAIAERLVEARPVRHLERLAANAELNLANARYYALTEPSDLCKLEDVSEVDVVESFDGARRRLVEAVDDPQHIEIAEFDFDLGLILTHLEDYDAAIASFESALAIYTAQHGPQSPVVGDVHRALGNAHGEARHLDLALQHAEANIRIRLLDPNGGPLRRAEAYELLGLIQNEQGASDAAHDSLIRAIDSFGSRPHADLELNELEQLYSCELNLAIVEIDRDEPAALGWAVARLRATRRVLEPNPGEAREDTALERLVQAAALVAEGDGSDALVLLDGIAKRQHYDPTLDGRIEKIRQRANEMK